MRAMIEATGKAISAGDRFVEEVEAEARLDAAGSKGFLPQASRETFTALHPSPVQPERSLIGCPGS